MPSLETHRSLGYRVLVHSGEASFLDRLRDRLPPAWDVTLSVTVASTIRELTQRHFDFFVTDEPVFILVLHDRFPNPDARERIARRYFGSEYAYLEFLREYHERHRELSTVRSPEIPSVLVRRYADPLRNEFYESARSATRMVEFEHEVPGAIEAVLKSSVQ